MSCINPRGYLEKVQNIWRKYTRALDEIKSMNKDYEELFDSGLGMITNYGLNRAIEGSKERLIRDTANGILKIHGISNIKLDEDVIQKFKNKEFNATSIYQHVLENYIEKASQVIIKEHVENSRKLIPKKLVNPSDIVTDLKERIMTLKVYWEYGRISFDTQRMLDSLEIVIAYAFGIDTTNYIPDIFTTSIKQTVKDKPGLFDYKEVGFYKAPLRSPIDSFKIYKNGRFDIKFRKDADARKVAEIFLSYR